MPTEIWPNFFIVGAQKCGTTSLWAHLKTHPQVFMREMKEPMFFLSRGPRPEEVRKEIPNCVGAPEKYLSLYKDAQGYPAIGDATPLYLWDKNAPGRIREVCPDAKIIVILRDPVIRAHSQFLMHRKLGGEPLPTFHEALKADLSEMAQPDRRFFGERLYVEIGLYYEQLKRYFDAFGRDRVLVLLLDDLHRDLTGTMAKVTQHLGIGAWEPAEDGAEEKSNVYKMPRPGLRVAFRITHRVFNKERREKFLPAFVNQWLRGSSLLYSTEKLPLEMESRLILQEIYEPDIAKLENLLGRNLPELRKSWV